MEQMYKQLIKENDCLEIYETMVVIGSYLR